MIDYNAYVGKWPFYSIPYDSAKKLSELYEQHGISGGYVSSVESIFYNDFYESELMLYRELKNTKFYHVVTPNPAFVECPVTLERCIRDFDVKGIRIHPEFHGFSLTDACLKPVIEIARKYKLPLFVTARMHDGRISHILHPRTISTDELRTFILENTDLKIILCHFHQNEIEAIQKQLFEYPGVFTDTTGLRGNLFGEANTEIYKKAVFGSGYPLIPVASCVYTLSELSGEAREVFHSREDVLL